MRFASLSGHPLLFCFFLTAFLCVPHTHADGRQAICIGQNSMVLAPPFGALALSGEPEPYSTMADGRVLAAASLRGDGIDSTNNGALVLLSPDAAPALLLQEAQSIAGGFFRQATQVTSDDNGVLVVVAVVGEEIYQGNRYNGPHFFAILAGTPDDLSVIANSRDVGSIERVRQSRSGQVAFFMDGELWGWSPGSVGATLLVPDEAVLPGLPENSTLWPLSQLQIGTGGQILFDAFMRTRDPEQPGSLPTSKSGYWLFDNGNVSEVVLEGDPVPTQPGMKFEGNINFFSFSETGWAVLSARIDDDGEFPFSSVLLAGNLFDGGVPTFKEFIEPPEEDLGSLLVGDVSDEGQLLVSRSAQDQKVFWLSPAGLNVTVPGDWIEFARNGHGCARSRRHPGLY